MEFLYFPEDKSEYLPSVISLLVFIAGAILTMYLIKRAAKKEEKQFSNRFDGQTDSPQGNRSNRNKDK